MAGIKVHAGDFSRIAGGSYGFGCLTLTPSDSKWGSPKAYHLKTTVTALEQADEKTGVRVFGAAGWGAVGAVLAGPAGLLVGGLLGGRAEKVVFVASFNDGKKVMAECDKKTWIKMLSERF